MSTSGPVLTIRQKSELEKAILDFLSNQGYTNSFLALQAESNNSDFTPSPTDRHHNLLAKKWTSVIRLQKKIIELEGKVQEFQEKLKSNVRITTKTGDVLPKPPSKFQLTQHRAPITRVAFHPSHTILASSSEDMTIKLWDFESGEFERTLKGHTKTVHGISFDPKGLYIASCSSDLTVRVWDSQNDYKNIKTLYGHDHSVSSVCFLGPDKIISASRDKTIKIWEFNTGYCIKTITGHAEWVRFVSVSEDNKLIVSASNDQSIRVWDASTGECKQDLRGHENVVECAFIAPVATYPFIHQLLALDSKTKIDPTPGQYVFSCSRDKTIKLWDCTGQSVFTFVGHDNWVRGLCFHPSGKYIISVSDDKLMKIWDLSNGRCKKSFEAASHFVTSIDYCSFANVVATGSVDTSVSIWECQ
ncbi:hypothetical protein BB558_000629 [Smittium angustum]|uniref:Nuclear distribution protein PAC1 n=1 Tax=Smittium angustum TaxID=133377 RepID=A0A2U1JDX1_SMIAN|nr:hypothetical protein BB558_000629 [Smittium angustum]